MLSPNLAAIGFVDGHSGHAAQHLQLHALAVDKLERGDDAITDHSSLGAAVTDNKVDLAFDLPLLRFVRGWMERVRVSESVCVRERQISLLFADTSTHALCDWYQLLLPG